MCLVFGELSPIYAMILMEVQMAAPQVSHQGAEGPQSALERKYIEEYLKNQGASLKNLGKLPKEEQQHLMREASKYASLKLAEVESRAKFREDIHAPS